jgi:hypothetical protein
MMARKAISVDDDRGVYQIALGAEPERWADVRKGALRIEVVESLLGWWPWQWSVRVDGNSYFVDGTGKPREVGSDEHPFTLA